MEEKAQAVIMTNNNEHYAHFYGIEWKTDCEGKKTVERDEWSWG